MGSPKISRTHWRCSSHSELAATSHGGSLAATSHNGSIVTAPSNTATSSLWDLGLSNPVYSMSQSKLRQSTSTSANSINIKSSKSQQSASLKQQQPALHHTHTSATSSMEQLPTLSPCSSLQHQTTTSSSQSRLPLPLDSSTLIRPVVPLQQSNSSNKSLETISSIGLSIHGSVITNRNQTNYTGSNSAEFSDANSTIQISENKSRQSSSIAVDSLASSSKSELVHESCSELLENLPRNDESLKPVNSAISMGYPNHTESSNFIKYPLGQSESSTFSGSSDLTAKMCSNAVESLQIDETATSPLGTPPSSTILSPPPSVAGSSSSCGRLNQLKQDLVSS